MASASFHSAASILPLLAAAPSQCSCLTHSTACSLQDFRPSLSFHGWNQMRPTTTHQVASQRMSHFREAGSLFLCRASENERVSQSRKTQLQATELLAELLKSDNPQQTAQQHVALLDQEFFMVASTYLSMAKKEANAEVVNRLETILKVAMEEREKSLRPEIRLLNQLLRDSGASERSKTMNSNLQYLVSDSYFFQLLNRMMMDVERQHNNPEKPKLLSLLRTIGKETKEASKALKRG